MKEVANKDNDPVRIKKTLREAETAAFTTQLFYFCMKVLFCYVLLRYRNALSEKYLSIGLYTLLLAVNTYFILTTGRNPGYEPKGSPQSLMLEQQNTDFIGNGIQESPHSMETPDDSHCSVCGCRKKMRMKHCYRCGRCVRKFDHHCPWIGACVGEGNHCRFFTMLFAQTVQAVVTFLICLKSMAMYEYKQHGQTPHSQTQKQTLQQFYSQQFGVFAIFSFFMFAYVLFVGGLFLFHGYLLAGNITTTELMSRSKAAYLKGIKGNPFSKGLLGNLRMAIIVPERGHFWQIERGWEGGQKGWLGKIWSNQYYDCC